MGTPLLGELADIQIEAGLNENQQAFLQVRASGTGQGHDVVLYGQIPPAAARSMAVQWLAAAEEAHTEALVARTLMAVFDIPEEPALLMVAHLRAARLKDDEKPEADT